MNAGLSLDLDNKWSYLKTHGDASWSEFPSYLDLVVPRVLKLLDELNLRITFFIVGKDASLASNREALGQIAQSGHEIGNHSFHHEPWMQRRSASEVDAELAMAEDAIEAATGQRPRGFRAPGYAQSQTILDVLVRRRYTYDASSLPTFIGPLARAYYFHTSTLGAAELKDREGLFGQFADGFRPNKQTRIGVNGTSLAEIPVTTMPGLRLPIHLSYVLYIAAISPSLALTYFRRALDLCKLTRTEPSILLHPLDFLSGEECPELRFFPAMQLGAVKERVVREALATLAKDFDVKPLRELVRIPELGGFAGQQQGLSQLRR